MNTITGQNAASEALFFLNDMIRFCNRNLDLAEKLIVAGSPFKASNPASYAVDALNSALEQRAALIEATNANLDPIQAAACQQALACKASLEADIAANVAKHAAVTTTLNDLAGEPVSEFHPAQWSALIDHAIVDEDTIRFVFRVGEVVRVQL